MTTPTARDLAIAAIAEGFRQALNSQAEHFTGLRFDLLHRAIVRLMTPYLECDFDEVDPAIRKDLRLGAFDAADAKWSPVADGAFHLEKFARHCDAEVALLRERIRRDPPPPGSTYVDERHGLIGDYEAAARHARQLQAVANLPRYSADEDYPGEEGAIIVGFPNPHGEFVKVEELEAALRTGDDAGGRVAALPILFNHDAGATLSPAELEDLARGLPPGRIVVVPSGPPPPSYAVTPANAGAYAESLAAYIRAALRQGQTLDASELAAIANTLEQIHAASLETPAPHVCANCGYTDPAAARPEL